MDPPRIKTSKSSPPVFASAARDCGPFQRMETNPPINNQHRGSMNCRKRIEDLTFQLSLWIARLHPSIYRCGGKPFSSRLTSLRPLEKNVANEDPFGCQRPGSMHRGPSLFLGLHFCPTH